MAVDAAAAIASKRATFGASARPGAASGASGTADDPNELTEPHEFATR